MKKLAVVVCLLVACGEHQVEKTVNPSAEGIPGGAETDSSSPSTNTAVTGGTGSPTAPKAAGLVLGQKLWTYTVSAATYFSFWGHADADENLFWIECPDYASPGQSTNPRPCELVSCDRHGSIRFRTTLPTESKDYFHPAINTLLLSGNRVFVPLAGNRLGAYSMAGGPPLWITNPIPVGGAYGDDGSRLARPVEISVGTGDDLYFVVTSAVGNDYDYFRIFAASQSSGAIRWTNDSYTGSGIDLFVDAAGELLVTGAFRGWRAPQMYDREGKQLSTNLGASGLPIAEESGVVIVPTSPAVEDIYTGISTKSGAPVFKTNHQMALRNEILASDGTFFLVTSHESDAHLEAIRASEGQSLWSNAFAVEPLLLTSNGTVLAARRNQPSLLEVRISDGTIAGTLNLPLDTEQRGLVALDDQLVVPIRGKNGNTLRIESYSVPGLHLANKGWVCRGGNPMRNDHAR